MREIGLAAALLLVGCGRSITTDIQACSFEIQKALLPWSWDSSQPSLDALVQHRHSFELIEGQMLEACIASNGWVYNIERVEALYKAGKSPGLVGQRRDPKNWSWDWFGLFREK